MSFRKSVSIRFKGLRSYGRFKKRYDVINYFLHTRNCETYLEIGVGQGGVWNACNPGGRPA